MFKKVSSKLNFDKQNPKTVYRLQTVRQSKVTSEQLVNDVHRASGVNKAQTQAVIEGLMDSLCHFMDLGHTVQMGGFGTFRPYFRTKAQDTIDKVGADNVVSCKIQFYPGKQLRTVMKNILLEDSEPGTDNDEIVAVADAAGSATNPTEGQQQGGVTPITESGSQQGGSQNDGGGNGGSQEPTGNGGGSQHPGDGGDGGDEPTED